MVELEAQEVIRRINIVAEENWKVKNLLRDAGPFTTWSERLQDSMLKILKVERTICKDTGITKFYEEQSDE